MRPPLLPLAALCVAFASLRAASALAAPALAAPASPGIPTAKVLPFPGAAYVVVDVALVRSAPRADAPVVTRLPINAGLYVDDPTPGPAGFVPVRISNDSVVGPAVADELHGYVRADLLGGSKVTAVGLEGALQQATSPEERLTVLERLMVLRGADVDRERLLGEAVASGEGARIARAKALIEPPPEVYGVCFAGHVALLAEVVNGRWISLVDEQEDVSVDAPSVRQARARLQARALQLTTLRYHRYSPAFGEDVGLLVVPRVVTTEDVSSTVRTRIELGPCPSVFGEVESATGIVYATVPLAPPPSSPVSSAEAARWIGALPGDLSGLHVLPVGPSLVELRVGAATRVLDRRSGATRACTDGCPSPAMPGTGEPLWVSTPGDVPLRIASETEDVTLAGWGSPDNAGMWAHPIFVLQRYSATGPPTQIVVTLDQYGC